MTNVAYINHGIKSRLNLSNLSLQACAVILYEINYDYKFVTGIIRNININFRLWDFFFMK